jgi:ribonucleoside-diphosphate reductase alpha chain
MEAWEKIFCERYPHESFESAVRLIVDELNKVATDSVRLTQEDFDNLLSRKCLPGGRYFANIKAPVEKRQLTNCFALSVEDTRESWCELLHDVAKYTMYGGGVGVDYSALRPNGAVTATPGQNAGGPCSLIRAVDRMVEQLRSCRRGALLAQLAWDHADIDEFFALKAKDDKQLSRTNISVKYDERWHDIIDAGGTHPEYNRAMSVFKRNLELAVTCAEPGLLFNGRKTKPFGHLTNACGELRTFSDGDSCNIGGIFLTNLETGSVEEAKSAAKTLIKCLLLGTKGSVTVTEKSTRVRAENNRLLIGYGGMFPWAADKSQEQIEQFLAELRVYIDEVSSNVANSLDMNSPKATTGIAPHGSLAIFAQTTGGIEPPFAEAMLRKIQNGLQRPRIHVMIDPLFKSLKDRGIACKTSQTVGFEERVAWQAMIQDHIDMGISSTINLPKRGTPGNDFSIDELASTVLKYHRRLAGLTCYPDGAISEQPLTPISYEEAMKYGDGAVVEDTESLIALSELMCKSGVCGA